MTALRLAFSLVRIPRLFITLFFWPLTIGILLVYGQLLITGAIINVTNRDSSTIEKRMKQDRDKSITRALLYGSADRLSDLKVCRWVQKEASDGKIYEVPPPECQPDRLDVAIQTDNVIGFPVEEYLELFQGNVMRLHVCKSCHPDVIIDVKGKEPVSSIHSIQGLLLLNTTLRNEGVQDLYVQAAREFDHVKHLLGKRHLYMEGFRSAVTFSGIYTYLALVFSICSLVIITLWLALKAHRKILDYFARNGALLPMVAATGKESFYAALWILTSLRVLAFLAFSVPLTISAFLDFVKQEKLEGLLGEDVSLFVWWLVALVSSMCLATLVASIADLKHRHSMMSFVYRYLPLIICIIGAGIWCFTLLVDGSASATVRSVLTGTPVVGIVPILIAPIFKPAVDVLTLHSILTVLVCLYVLRANAHWFAAHLEEI